MTSTQYVPPALPESDDVIKIGIDSYGQAFVIALGADQEPIKITDPMVDSEYDDPQAEKEASERWARQIGEAVELQLRKIWGLS